MGEPALDRYPNLVLERNHLLEESLRLLDFPEVRFGLASNTTLEQSRQMALSMVPSFIHGEIVQLHLETAEAITILEDGKDLILRSVKDVSSSVARASKNGLLTGQELLEISEMIELQRNAKSTVGSFGDSTPILGDVAEQIPDLDEISRQIGSSIGALGEVLDNASPGLGMLREEVRRVYKELELALGLVINSPDGVESLQDQVISLRSDRLVIQIKTDHRHRIPGVVHGASNTGATLFIEPITTVDLGNQWRELVLEEKRETELVLRDLSNAVGILSNEIDCGTRLTARLDFIMARAKFGSKLFSHPITIQSEQNDNSLVQLIQARHPLLGETAMPINIQIGADWSILVITGPNMGGKTAALKTMGLLALMHQSGLPVSVEPGSTMPVFDGIFTDIGDHQDIKDSTSTFGAHVRNLSAILRHVSPSSLVLLDELGSSTDPEEGSALAKALLNHICGIGSWTIVTTHHRNVAAHADSMNGMNNASVELDSKTMRPTYHLTLGLPGRSYAISVGEQMGLPDEILEDARSLMEPQHVRFEDWLRELQSSRQQLKERLEDVANLHSQTEASRDALSLKLEEIEVSRDQILEEFRQDIESEYDRLRKRMQRAKAALSWSISDSDKEPIDLDIDNAGTVLEETKNEIAVLGRNIVSRKREMAKGPLSPGQLVDVQGMNIQGVVKFVDERGQEAVVRVGNVNLKVGIGRLTRTIEPIPVDQAPAGINVDLGPVLNSADLDLRGMQSEDALLSVEEFLDKALRDGLSSVRIIHGKGGGILRDGVRHLLKDYHLVKSFRPETPDNGGDGATYVNLT